MMARESRDAIVLTLGEAAQFVRVSEKTLGELAREGSVPAKKVGREWRFLRTALEEWLTGGGASIAAEPEEVYAQKALFENSAEVEDVPKDSTLGDSAFTNNRREPLHRWVPWIAGFSAEFVENVLDRIPPAPPRDVTVLDPFAGVGTTLLEGLKRGHSVVGFEINPYAALACRVKLDSVGCDEQRLCATVGKFCKFAKRKLASETSKPVSVPPPHFQSRRQFFSQRVERQVLFALDFIKRIDDASTRDLFRTALGSIMVSCSNYSYEPSLSTRQAAGKTDVMDADVAGMLSKKLYEMAADIGFLQRCLARFDYVPSATLHEGSFLEDSGKVEHHSIDVLITSPPYLNNYHYVRNTRPQLYWLGLMDNAREIEKMAGASFGKFWQTVRSGPELSLSFDIGGISSVIEMIRSQNTEKGPYGGPGWANYACAYFNDCHRFCTAAKGLMKPGGLLVIVIGNNILQGIEVKTDRLFAQIAESLGFRVLNLHQVRRKRTGTSIIKSSVRVGGAQERVELYETAVELQAP
jgi:excisionase family DNA binding protein